MEHAQNLDGLAPHTVGHDVARIGHDQLTCARNSTRPTESGLLLQLCNGIEYTLDDQTRGRRIVSRDVRGFIVENAQ